MKPSLTKSVLLALFLLQCTSIVYTQDPSGSNAVVSGQQQPETPQATSDAPAPSSAAPPAPETSVAEKTSEEPKPTSDQTPAPTTTAANDVPSETPKSTEPSKPDTPSATSDNTPEPTKSDNPGKSTGDKNTTGKHSGTASDAAPSSTSSSDTSSPVKPPPEEPTNKTAIIAGSVVGGLVGIALIAGLLTWCNRRGGCTSRTRRRDAQTNFDAGQDEYDMKMTDNHGVSVGAAGAMHSSDNLPPPSPFQHARRFVPPTSNPTGYMNLNDEEYGYHQNANAAAYQPQQAGYQDYNNAPAAAGYHDGSHPDYNQDYQQDYYNQQQHQQQDYVSHDYSGNSVNGNSVGYTQAEGAYYNGHIPGSNLTSPTLTNAPNAAGADYRQQLKPDQIEQKPNAA